MSAYDEDGIGIANTVPREQEITMADYCRMRGYDPTTKTYATDEAPDFGAVSRLPSLRTV